MSQDQFDAFRLARLASTGRLAAACVRHLHRLQTLATGTIVLPKAGDITRQFLTSARRPPTQELVVDLGDLVDEMRELLSVLAGPDAIIVAVRDAVRVRTLGNRGDLEQLLFNLIDAPADDATPRRLTITSGIADWPGGPTDSGELTAGRYASLSVADDQCVAPPEFGLPLVREIARGCGGALVVDRGADGVVVHRVLLLLAP